MSSKGIILVHDAARPFIQSTSDSSIVEVANNSGAAVAAVRAKDTMKKVDNGIIQETVDRESLWIIQTPQAFQYDNIRKSGKIS